MKIPLIYMETDKYAIGLRTVSAFLKEAGHHTRLIFMETDEQRFSSEELEQVRELVGDSDIIGISSLARSKDKARQVIEYLRSLDKFLVWGGVHATLNPKECAKSANLVCVGEGEEFMLELLERIEGGSDWKDLANAAYVSNGTVVLNPMRPLIKNLDELPNLDFCNDDEYHLTKGGFNKVYNMPDEKAPIMFIGSRGCAYHCNYCSNAKLQEIFKGKGRYVRRLSVSKYIENAKSMRKYFPNSKYFYFNDEDFMSRSVSDMKGFSEKYPKEIGLPFEVMASPMAVTQEKVELLCKAGIWRIRMGLESGSERTKKEVYNRSIPNKSVLRAVYTINKYPQIMPFYLLVISNPYEGREDLLQTVQFIRKLPVSFYVNVHNLVFFPGTHLYERAIKDGIIHGMQDSGYELDFRGGLHYKNHAWKSKNLYLNGLLCLMEGKGNNFRLGLIPRIILPILYHPIVINFNERRPFFIKTVISRQLNLLSLRKRVFSIIRQIFLDPMFVYRRKMFKIRNRI